MAAAPDKGKVYVNFFKPTTAHMKAEVTVAGTVIAIWALLSYGIPVLIWLAGLGGDFGESFITNTRFLGFPLHYWLLAQGCTIGYVCLTKVYDVMWNRKVKAIEK